MPTYDYFCESNGQTIEVRHKISECIDSWGALCERAKLDLGDTPVDAPVRKLIGGGAVIGAAALKNPEPACGSGGCASGMCNLK